MIYRPIGTNPCRGYIPHYLLLILMKILREIIDLLRHQTPLGTETLLPV